MRYVILTAMIAVAGIGCAQEANETPLVQQNDEPFVAAAPLLEGTVGEYDAVGEARLELSSFEDQYSTIRLIREEEVGAVMLVLHFEGMAPDELSVDEGVRALLCSGPTSDYFTYDREADLVDFESTEVSGGIHYDIQAEVFNVDGDQTDILIGSFEVPLN